MKGRFDLDKKFEKVGSSNLYISEITLAELKYGVENSENQAKNKKALLNFLTGVQILPIIESLDIFAKEKTRLRKLGAIIDDFDLLIGSTGVAYDFTVVTNNFKHLGRIDNIKLEDWTK
jgi:tRNA(fMet)-specific endonuclease VapC